MLAPETDIDIAIEPFRNSNNTTMSRLSTLTST